MTPCDGALIENLNICDVSRSRREQWHLHQKNGPKRARSMVLIDLGNDPGLVKNEPHIRSRNLKKAHTHNSHYGQVWSRQSQWNRMAFRSKCNIKGHMWSSFGLNNTLCHISDSANKVIRAGLGSLVTFRCLAGGEVYRPSPCLTSELIGGAGSPRRWPKSVNEEILKKS